MRTPQLGRLLIPEHDGNHESRLPFLPRGEQNGLGSAISRSDRMAVGVGSRRSGVSGLLFQRGSSYRAFLTQRDSGSNVTFLKALLALTFMFFKEGRILNYENALNASANSDYDQDKPQRGT